MAPSFRNIVSQLNCLNCFGNKQKPEEPQLPEPNQPGQDGNTDNGLSDVQKRNKQQYEEWFADQRKGMNIMKTTTHKDGTVIDWIPMESQANGNIATPPPVPELPKEWDERKAYIPKPLLEQDETERGPAGTVPVPRQDIKQLDFNRSLKTHMSKSPPVDPQHPAAAIQAAQPHWYASSAQAVANRGGAGTFSLYKAYTQYNNDFSLLQTAVIKYNVPKPGNTSQNVMQTVEAGWINYPAQVAAPHLFTFYTTNGYSANGNNIGGWNRDQAGWVQVDNTIFPGTSFSPLSADGGAQYELPIRFYLYQGNWWLLVIDRYIGYYPASLFGAGTDAGRSLQNGADQINFYGEIYQSGSSTTTTDMGSGQFPELGFGKSGYMRNIVYIDGNNNAQAYDGGSQIIVSDNNRYRIAPSFRSNTNWGSYAFVGGPGAGGRVNG